MKKKLLTLLLATLAAPMILIGCNPEANYRDDADQPGELSPREGEAPAPGDPSSPPPDTTP